MKKRNLLVAALAIFTSITSPAYDLSSLFGSGSGKDILESLGATIQNATATQNFSIDELTGTWKYNSPAVAFKSDNAVKKLGGAAAATTIENKLSPYYNRAGLNSMILNVDKNHNFSIQIKAITLKGTVSKDADGNLYFNFKAFGKTNIGKVACMATKSNSLLNLTFDAKKLIEISKKIASISKNSTFNSIAELLSSYDGVYVGVKLKK